MKDRMAIRTYGPKVVYRINLVLFPNGCQVLQVMDVNDTFRDLAVQIGHASFAHRTVIAIVVDTRLPSRWTTLVGIQGDFVGRTFLESFRR
jgi:hypothetical protein